MKKIKLTILGIISTSFSVFAQLSPMKSQYFQNPYLVNPAMAAKDGGASLFTNFSSQWSAIEGSPRLLSLSGSTPIARNAAVGLNIISDKAGLLKRTQAMGSFAYKLPITDEQSVRFGISLAWTQDGIDNGKATSNGINDPSLVQYNNLRENNWDGNFGIAYISEGLEVQFSYLNLNQKRSAKFSTVDYSTFYSSLAYKFKLDESFNVKPMVVYRGINKYKNQWDVAAEWGMFSQDFNLYTIYHSNKSISGGFGFNYNSKLLLSGFYNSEPSEIRGFAGGIFDVVVGYKF